jgi:phage baseplate assembly protein W
MATESPRQITFGRSLQLVNGDLAFENGDFAMIEGRDNFLLAMQVMIETPFGSDVFNVNYGFDLFSVMSLPQTVGSAKAVIRLNIVKSLTQDDRVREVKEIVFDDEPRFFEISPNENESEHRTIRKTERRWQTMVLLETISEGEVALLLEGTGLKT